MTRRLYTMLGLELSLAIALGAFLIKANVWTQLLSMLLLLATFVAWMFLLGALFRRQSAQQRFYKVAVLFAAPLYIFISTPIAISIDNFLFARSLWRYQNIVDQTKSGAIKLQNDRIELPSQDRDLAYRVWVDKKKNVWTITFLVGGGFPVKHRGYIYKSDDKWTNADWRNWSSYKRRAPYWFEASD